MRISFQRAAAAAALLLVATATKAAVDPQPIGTTVVRIGVAGPLSGPIGHLGREIERSAQLAIDEANAQAIQLGGKPVRFELVSVDDRGDARRGVEVAQQLVDAGVVAVVGHLNSGVSIPAARVYGAAGIAQVTPASTNPFLTRHGHRHVFRLVPNDHQTLARMATHWAAQSAGKNALLVHDRTVYGQVVTEGFMNGWRTATGQAAQPALQLVTSRSSEPDVSAIVAVAQKQAPDVIVYGGMDGEAATLARELRAAGVAAPIIGGEGICSPIFAQLTGSDSDNVWCGEAGDVDALNPTRTAERKRFDERYEARFKDKVIVYGPFAYDAVNLIVEAMRRSDSANPARLIDAIRESNSEGVTGAISFDAAGDPKVPTTTLYRFQNGKRVFVQVLR